MLKNENLKMRHLAKIILNVIFLSFVLIVFSHAAFGQDQVGKTTAKKVVKHHSVKVAKISKPKHIVKVDLSDTPSETDVEPLTIGQKVSEKLVLSQTSTSEKLAKKALVRKHSKILLAQDLNIGSASAGSTFGTAAEGRFPASVNEDSTQMMSQKNKSTLSAKLNSRDLKKMLQSLRKKTDQSIREEYD